MLSLKFSVSNKKFIRLITPLGEMSVLEFKFNRKLTMPSAKLFPCYGWLISGLESSYCNFSKSLNGWSKKPKYGHPKFVP